MIDGFFLVFNPLRFMFSSSLRLGPLLRLARFRSPVAYLLRTELRLALSSYFLVQGV